MYELVITNKNYSSWSLRPWVLMRERGIAFRYEAALTETWRDQAHEDDVTRSGELLEDLRARAGS